MTATVAADSLVTLHYAMSLPDGTPVLTTFDATPATLRLGNGELSPVLEQCLIGLPEGERRSFLLEDGIAFGPYNPELEHNVPRDQLPKHVELAEMAVLEFTAPAGGTFTGLVRGLTDTHARIDFNHPLAGKSVKFDVHIVGIS